VPVMAQGGASFHRPPPRFSPNYAATAISTGSEIAKSTSSGKSTGIAPRIISDPTLFVVEMKIGVAYTEHSAKMSIARSYFRLCIQPRKGKQCLTDTLL
jgi:hypothetical protein